MKTVTFTQYTKLVVSFFLLWGAGSGPAFGGPPGAGEFKLPQYERFVLDNGLTVYLMEQHEVPLIYVCAVFPAGSVKDGGSYGLAALTADALLFGTGKYTKSQIEETLDFLGASYATSASTEEASVTMSFINTDQDRVFPILKDVIVNPVFDAAEFDKRKTRLLLELERAKERPSRVIGAYFNKFLYEDNAYGNPASGTRTSVSNITNDEVKAFYLANYIPAESAVAIVGDFETKKMKKKVQQLFGDWRREGSSSEVRSGQTQSFGSNRVLLINKEDATETRFRIGSFGIKRSNPDFVPVQVVNTILGGRFTSWLNDELRVNAGLTYGAFSFFATYRNSGIFAMNSFTPTETTIEAIDLALEVLDRLHEKGIDEETLTSAKNYIKGQYPPLYETAGSLAELLTSMFIYDFDESFINEFQNNVDQMTVEKSREIVNRYFPRENLQFVLIGRASEIRDVVGRYGRITEKEITAEGF